MMRNDFYPAGTVQALLQTDFVSSQTKQALQHRLDTPIVTESSFFTKEEFTTLQAVCKRLLPQPAERENKIDVAGLFDTNMQEGKTANGWRYSTMPPDEDAFHEGLHAIERSSQSLYDKGFQELADSEQDELLQNIQHKRIAGKEWEMLPSDLFFKEMFAVLVEIYYSHPVGKDEIGDASFADAKGWQHIQLNEKETREPKMINSSNK